MRSVQHVPLAHASGALKDEPPPVVMAHERSHRALHQLKLPLSACSTVAAVTDDAMMLHSHAPTMSAGEGTLLPLTWRAVRRVRVLNS